MNRIGSDMIRRKERGTVGIVDSGADEVFIAGEGDGCGGKPKWFHSTSRTQR